MKILIIGASGFIGRNLYEYLGKKDCFELEGVSSRELNLLDEEAVHCRLRDKRYDVIIHAAVYNPRVGIAKQPDKELEYDLRMFYNLEKYQDLYGRMIYFGSGAEYGKQSPICSVSEEVWGNAIPGNAYGLAKYIIGRQIENSRNIYNLRVFGLFGKYENWRRTFISGACCKALKKLPITIRKNVYFDYLYIDDFCQMVERFIQLASPQYHSYNITSGRRMDLISLAETVRRVSGREVPVIVCEEGLANEYTADNRRLLAEIGTVEMMSYETAVEKLYAWYETQEKEIDILSLLYQ